MNWDWATKRKIKYLAGALGFIFLVVIIPLIISFFRSPTCTDSKKNGTELGVDCGGVCTVRCDFEVKNPVVLWQRSFKVSPGIYNAVAYIQNPNVDSKISDAEYVFKFYDENNKLIGERSGKTFVPKNKVFGIFESGISAGNSIPKKTTFEFTNKLVWIRDLEEEPAITIDNNPLIGESTSPRVSANIQNKSIKNIKKMELVAIVSDDKGNAIGASRTFVDNLKVDSTAGLNFTWPGPFETEEDICKVGDRPESLGVMLVIDRSGSMAFDQLNPPQPLTDSKNAASAFVDVMKDTDKIGMVSFSNTASDPVDAELTHNYDNLKKLISGMSIFPPNIPATHENLFKFNTNIADGLLKAKLQLESSKGSNVTDKVIVLLTDGKTNLPKKQGDADYPLKLGESVANEVKNGGTKIYIIGLGKDVDEPYLKGLATLPTYYYYAATSKDLMDIYKQIAISICKNGPAVIQIIPRIIPEN